MVDNLFDVVLLAPLALPAVLYLQTNISRVALLGLTAVLLLLEAAALYWFSAPTRLTPVVHWLARVPGLAQRLHLAERTAVLLLPPPKRSLLTLLYTFLLNGALAFTYFLIGRAMDLPATWAVYFAIFPVAQLSLIIAVAPGGLGIFDLGWLGLLRLSGLPEEQALAFVIAQRAYIFVFVLVWAGVSALLGLTADRQAVGAKQNEWSSEPSPVEHKT